MKRAHRLRRPNQFQRVRREGRTYQHPLLRLNVAASRTHHIRCGIVVGKRIGNAVQRNRARRRVREAVRLSLPHLTRGHDLIVVIRSPDVIAEPFSSLRAILHTLLHRAGIWQSAETIPPTPASNPAPPPATSTPTHPGQSQKHTHQQEVDTHYGE